MRFRFASRSLSSMKQAPETLAQRGKAATDAAHIAIATVHGMDFLLTWNCVHIANAVIAKAVANTCRQHGFECPFICTPEELF